MIIPCVGDGHRQHRDPLSEPLNWAANEAHRREPAIRLRLPPEQIAQTAAEPRDSARLLVIHRADGRLEHRIFRDLPDYLRPGDLLVLNQTRVIPARLQAAKVPTGGAVEILLVQRIDDRHWLAMIGGKNIRQGSRLALRADNMSGVPPVQATVIEMREESLRVVEFSTPVDPYLDTLGQLPLPPYIHTPLADPERYQTVYAIRPPGGRTDGACTYG
jgi:S-adenosylmethionine:tRNA ribosyltransferase-isomerase